MSTVVIVLLYLFSGHILAFALRIGRAILDVLKGDGTLKENIAAVVDSAPKDDFQVRVQRKDLPLKSGTLLAYDIELRGALTQDRGARLSIVCALNDVTNGSPATVYSCLTWQQEEETGAYQEVTDLGDVPPDQWFSKWVKVGTLIPDALTGPYAGTRTLRVIAQIMPTQVVPVVRSGRIPNGTPPVRTRHFDFEERLTTVGWLEAEQQRQEANEIMVQLAVALGSVDGSFDAHEARAIQEWMRRQLEMTPPGSRETIKNRLNAVFKEAHTQARAGNIDVAALSSRLASFEMPAANRALMELLTEIAGADNELSENELALVRTVGKRLGVSPEEVAALAEKQFLGKNVTIAAGTTAESTLGIQSDWTTERIRSHLRSEFKKWNGRMQAMDSDEERAKAQAMIDLIAQLRQKYS
jgi:uncharacterized tellurite resistance protein B-like protein